MINKEKLAQEIAVNFNLNMEQTEAALLLLETRAANMDMSLQEYMHTYHPLGFSEKDYRLSDEYKGYVRFLADDAKAIIKTGKNADFFTFLHEQAHIYRRQLSGTLKEKAEKAFDVTDGKWTRHQEELFAIGYEEYARLRMAQTEDLREVYEKGCRCMRHIYNGLDRIIGLNPDIIKVYDELFTESRFRFKQDKFETAVQNIYKNNVERFKSSHVYLGMTPPIYQELGFDRLPVMITARHLKSVMQDWGSDTNVNYHGLTADIIAQIPEAIKKPLLIIQSQNKEHPEDIIAIVELKDKNNNPIIIPFSPNKKGYTNDIEIDINLAKSIYGKDNFDRFIQRAAQENRILYLNKKSRVLAIPRVQYPSNQGSQLLYDNIARYQEIVKRKISDFAKLYQTASPNSILFQKSSYYSKSTQKEKREQEIAQIADYFIKAIETNTAPWMKPWKVSEYINDFNPVTQTTYSGINSVLLPFIREFKFNSTDPRWYTFNNAKEEGYMVKKGEQANSVIFFSTIPIGKDGKALEVDEKGEPVGEAVKFIPNLKLYKVFHASQLGVPQFDKDGSLLRDEKGSVITEPIQAFEPSKIESINFKPIEAAERIIKQSGALIYHDQRDRSFYSLDTDSIHLCPKKQYLSEAGYYGVALHELMHWTGSSQRLDRSLDTYGLDEESRAREELIAEIGSYALCKDLKLDFNPQNNVTYVQSWCRLLQDKPDEIIKASREAIKAKDFIQEFDRIPEHEQKLNTVPKKEEKQYQFNVSSAEKRCYNPASGKIYTSSDFENHLQAIKSDDKRYLQQNEIEKLGLRIKEKARPILMKSETEKNGKTIYNYELLYNGKDIAGLPPVIDRPVTKVQPVQRTRSPSIKRENDYGMELG